MALICGHGPHHAALWTALSSDQLAFLTGVFTLNISPIMPDFCQDCTCGRAQANGGDDSVDQVARDSSRPERSFTAPLDWAEPTEGVEPAVPLRSKMWWNNPEDGESLGRMLILC